MSYNRDRKMHDATCGDCGKQCQVPFEPRQDKPVYCGECFQKHKPQNRGGSRFGGRGGGRFGGRGGSGGRGGFNRRPRDCLLYTSPSPRDLSTSRMPSSA